jgi:16S rRNA C967 or C1407 C5-methylase (RsmB/RsmF family)
MIEHNRMAKREKVDFDSFFSRMHGARWLSLKEALLRPAKHCELTRGLLKPYYLDEASVIAAKELGTREGDSILDLCAAPGGKSLVLAVDMGESGLLTANDRSRARRERLRQVLREHLPPDNFRRIRITGHDASRWGLYEKDRYDRVLLDAPCSSERHVLNSPHHLKKWSSARTKHLSIQEYAMLAAAVTSVKPGGTVLYCTCTISRYENDDVIHKLSERLGSGIETIPSNCGSGETTQYGLQIWPDTADGLGPMYIAKIRKKPSPLA